MKIQDILFVAIFLALVFARKPVLLVWSGMLSLILAIGLFATWTFFTAERLTWYAAVFFLTYLIISLLFPRRVQ